MEKSIFKLKTADTPVSYDPGVDILLMILSQDESLFNLETSENFIRTIAYDNEYSHNLAFDNSFAPIVQDCMFEYHIPFSIAEKTIDNVCDFISVLLNERYYTTYLCDTFWIHNYSTFGAAHQELYHRIAHGCARCYTLSMTTKADFTLSNQHNSSIYTQK